jgi:hypothetical protein
MLSGEVYNCPDSVAILHKWILNQVQHRLLALGIGQEKFFSDVFAMSSSVPQGAIAYRFCCV